MVRCGFDPAAKKYKGVNYRGAGGKKRRSNVLYKIGYSFYKSNPSQQTRRGTTDKSQWRGWRSSRLLRERIWKGVFLKDLSGLPLNSGKKDGESGIKIRGKTNRSYLKRIVPN